MIVELFPSVGVPESTPVVELKSSQAGVPVAFSSTPYSVKNEKLPDSPTAQRDRGGEIIDGA